MNNVMRVVPFIVFCALIIAVPPAWANWVQDGVALCTATADQSYPQIVSDGAGGAIVTWVDSRSGNYDIYAQRVNASGAVQWTTDGVALCTAPGDNIYRPFPTTISDGAGGAIVTWYDQRIDKHGIYTQRINASGEVQWMSNGVALCTNTGVYQWNPTITFDGAGGAVVTWMDNRTGNYNIYAQRVNASGAVQWTTNGVALCTAAGYQGMPQIASDGAGGAVVTWYDYRSGSNYDIYAQRVNASGAVQWTANGTALCTATGDQDDPVIISDGAGGAVIAWRDHRIGTISNIYAQRVNASGLIQWTPDGVAFGAKNGGALTIASDGAGGAMIAWMDNRGESSSDIYAQRVNASGTFQWAADGVALCTAMRPQLSPAITSNDAGDAIVTWHDGRGEETDIYAMKVNASGVMQWATDGVALCTATGEQGYPVIVSDGAGGAIVSWLDYRSGTGQDIYAQRICEGVAPVATFLASFSARVEESVVRVAWELSEPGVGLTFDVLRSSVGPETFEEIPVTIESRGKAYSFADMHCTPGAILRYRVDVTESGARRTLFETDAVTVPAERIALFQNSPNPFNPMTTLRYYLPGPCRVTLSIHDASGRLVATVVDREEQEAGQHTLIWSGLDSRGRTIPSGVYFSLLTAGKERLSNKMILLR